MCAKRKAASPDHERGFLMLEVLVGMVILALALGLLFQIFAASLRATALAGEYTRAARHAEAALARIGIEEPVAEGVRMERIDDTYQRSVTVEPYADGEEDRSAALRPYQVTVAVGWGEGERARAVALTTVRLARVP